MNTFIDNVVDQLNLRWAWEKVRRQAQPGEIWFDEIELAGFELELERHLQGIAREISKGTYKLTPLRPVPYPKRRDKDGIAQIRQTFQVSIRDQVAWTAVVNVVGPFVDSKMPVWSYGNRLHRTIWIEEDEEKIKHRKIGHYRHASAQLYLPFQQSWPVFRRHVYLTTRSMAHTKHLPRLDERDHEEQELQRALPEQYRCPFIDPDYWHKKGHQERAQELYWCCIDLKKFYPSLRLDTIKRSIVNHLPMDWRQGADRLLHSMFRFRLDLSGWREEELSQVNLHIGQKSFSHIPTGLYVAGFLANAGMLSVDDIVAKRLEKNSIAHFRFVDDHIILAYNFEDLLQWIIQYEDILSTENTGAKINLAKVDPEPLAEMLLKIRQKKASHYKNDAINACKIDPKFPAPLMTKTIALVSNIARTDFNLLNANELATLTDQLEHLLLVDLPEEEIPEKTRLSFAAARLTQISERMLTNDTELITSVYQKDKILLQLREKALKEDQRSELEKQLKDVEDRISAESTRLQGEMNRVFQLLRKVLREEPHSVRIWTRALIMCRLTGVKGLSDLFYDIEQVKKEDALTAEYLTANALVLLGDQAIAAARTIDDRYAAQWRKDAANKFLIDLGNNQYPPLSESTNHSILHNSWHIYNYGLYCSSIIINEEQVTPELSKYLILWKNTNVTRGQQIHSRAAWAWWAVRKTLVDLSPKADHLARQLGRQLDARREDVAYWRFFPLDITNEIISAVANGDIILSEGWWYEALRELRNAGHDLDGIIPQMKGPVRRAKRAIEYERKNTVSLYEWCDILERNAKGNEGDPRSGEWTTLEIVKQIAFLINADPNLATYIARSRHIKNDPPSVHPANFRIPREWCEIKEPTWDQWKRLVQDERIERVADRYSIRDRRYTPVIKGNMLFTEINPVRGLGLLLYGLLSCNFSLPAIWNGHGHSDVLVMLPKILLNRMTCSSWTLGLLQGCLMPRPLENMYIKQKSEGHYIDDDTLHDPVSFINAKEVADALSVCQKVLEKFQLSTFGHEARQLTIIDILQLTQPDWNKVYSLSVEED